MNKLLKIIVTTGLCCVLAGGLLAAVLAVGFKDEVIANFDEMHIGPEDYADWIYDVNDEVVNISGADSYNAADAGESYFYEVPADETVHSICFEFAVGDIRIVDGDTLSVQVTDMYKDAISSEVKEGTWYIYDDLLNKGKIHTGYSPEIVITVPSTAMNFEQIEIELAAGVLQAESICGADVRLKVDAGSLRAEKLVATEYLDMTNGVGEIVVEEINANNLTMDNGVGRIDLCGSVCGQNFVKCGIGEVCIRLRDRKDADFDYDVDCGIGEVIVAGSHYRGNGKHSHQGHQGRGDRNRDRFQLECGIGRIEISVED